MRPTFDDLKHLWTVAYSRSALLEADRWLDKMDSVSSDGELLSGLVCAVIAAYGRPFTQSRDHSTHHRRPRIALTAPFI
jgi:hypothetical protein